MATMEQLQVELDEYVFGYWDISFPNRFPPSMNQILRQHWRWSRKQKKEFTQDVCTEARLQNIPALPKIYVQLRLFFPNRLRRDMDNYSAKYFVDGLVEAGVVPDDSPEFVFALPTLIGYNKILPCTVLRIYRDAPFLMAKGVMDVREGSQEDTGRHR